MNLDTLDINVVIAGSGEGKTNLLCKVASMQYGVNVVFITTESSKENILRTIGNVETYIHVFQLAVGSSMFQLYKILLDFKEPIDLLIVDSVEHFTHISNDSLQSKLAALSDVRKELGCEIWTSISKKREY